MPKSSSTHFASTAHKTVHDALHNHFALRTAKIRDTHYMMSKVYSQVYESGPVAWRVSVHADDRGGDGPYTAQVTVSCERKTGEVTYFGEPRRNPKTGDRYAPSNANLSFCTKVAGKVAERAEVTPDPHYAPTPPKATKALPATPAPWEDSPIYSLFGAPNDPQT